MGKRCMASSQIPPNISMTILHGISTVSTSTRVDSVTLLNTPKLPSSATIHAIIQQVNILSTAINTRQHTSTEALAID